MGKIREQYGPLLESIAFAARAHKGQLRKDRRTPYVSHVVRVCFVVRHVFGCDDLQVLMAAILHDTIEDTTTDYDDLRELFEDPNSPVAEWVALLSKDKRMPEPAREARYQEALATAPWPVKLCKLADLFDNLLDSEHLPPDKRAKLLRRSSEVLQVLMDSGLEPESAEKEQIHQRAVHFVQDLISEVGTL